MLRTAGRASPFTPRSSMLSADLSSTVVCFELQVPSGRTVAANDNTWLAVQLHWHSQHPTRLHTVLAMQGPAGGGPGTTLTAAWFVVHWQVRINRQSASSLLALSSAQSAGNGRRATGTIVHRGSNRLLRLATPCLTAAAATGRHPANRTSPRTRASPVCECLLLCPLPAISP